MSRENFTSTRCRFDELPWEVLEQIMRHLIPTGGILHASSTKNIHAELHDHIRPDQFWHVMQHITPHDRSQHRFLPGASMSCRRNLTAIASVNSRLNDVFNSVLYGGNTWLLDLTAQTGPTSLPIIDKTCWRAGYPEHLKFETCALEIDGLPLLGFIAVWPSQLPMRSLATWPLTRRTAPYVRDLAITAQLGREWHNRPFNEPYAETFCSFAAVEQLEEIVALFTGTAPYDVNKRKRRALRHLAVELGSYDRADWQIIAHQPSAAADDAFVPRNWSPGSLHLRPCVREPRFTTSMEPVEPRGVGRLWEPLRHIHGVRRVELAGALPADLASELKTSIMSEESLR
jgi:hypothetical protein